MVGKGTLKLRKEVNIQERLAQKDAANTITAGNHTSRCYILIGVPGSGKSYWTDSILRYWKLRGRPVIICDDDINRAHGCVLDQDAMKRECLRLFHEALGVQRDIIIDRHNLTVDDREAYLSLLPKSYEKVGIYFTAPKALLTRRLQERMVETGQPFSDIVLSNMLRKLEKPAYDEFDRHTDIDHTCVY